MRPIIDLNGYIELEATKWWLKVTFVILMVVLFILTMLYSFLGTDDQSTYDKQDNIHNDPELATLNIYWRISVLYGIRVVILIGFLGGIIN